MTLTPADVRDKQFTPTRFKTGYDEDEVDAFLDLVEAALTTLHDRVAELEADVADGAAGLASPPPAEPAPDGAAYGGYAPAEPAPADVAAVEYGGLPAFQTLPSDVPVAPVTTEQLEMEEMLRRTLLLAQRTADEAVREAREEAARIVAEAQARADAEEREADVRLAAVMHARELDRQRLEAQVESLMAFEREYRTRLRAYLQMQLRDLETGQASPPVADTAPDGGIDTAKTGTPRLPDPTDPAPPSADV